MKIAVCYRGHFRRTYVAEKNVRYNVDFFKNLNNHKEKLIYEGIWQNGNPKNDNPVPHFEDLNIFNC